MSPSPNPATITVPTASGVAVVTVPDLHDGILDWSTIIAIQSAVAAAYVSKYNSGLVARYTAAVRDYNIEMESGSFPNAVSPIAPSSYVYVPGDADTPATYTQTGPPVNSLVPIDTINRALNKPSGPNAAPLAPGESATFDIGVQFAPGWFQALADDTEPAGYTKTIPGPDGKLITVRKDKLPWGSHYEQIG